MSAKNLDNHNRWRNKTIAFRVSPEENEQIEIAVRLSGLTKQDYITRRLLDRAVVVQGNPRVYKALRDQLAAVLKDVPFPVSWTVKMKKKQKETQDILSYHSQAAGCSDKARAKASGGRQPIEECGRTGL